MPRQLLRASRGGSDLADLLERVDESFERAASVDRAALFHAATHVVKRAHPASIVALIDLAVDRRAEVAFIEALVAGSETAFATMPASDRDGIARLEAMGGTVQVAERPASQSDAGDLACLRRYLFNREAPPAERSLDGSLSFFSAPGEGREAVEIARRILREARAGVRFDEMAVLVRSPQHYIGLIEHAFGRAKVPAWFSRGTRRPLTAGRAFLALLACAAEQLSASRFAEYLSFAQVPLESEKADASWVASQDESFGRVQPAVDESRTRVPNPESRVPNPESRVPSPESRDPESRVPNPESRVPSPEPESRSRLRPRWNTACPMALGSAHRRCRRDRS